MVTYDQVESLSKTYSLEEIMELNDLEEVDVIYILIKGGFCEIPSPKPVDM